MTELARNQGGRAHFTERKYIALLDKPVVSSGEMRYTAPDYLEKRTLTPRLESRCSTRTRSVSNGQAETHLCSQEQPEILAL